jgi:hypothetical protein
MYRGRRLDRNPLRRPSDRAETLIGLWMLVLVAVLIPVVARAAALTTEHIASDARITALATLHQVTATTVEAAPTLSSTPYGSVDTWPVNATWTADGSLHRGQIQVAASSPRGSRERIWVTTAGNLNPPPLTASQVTGLKKDAAMISLPVMILMYLIVAALIRLAFRRHRSAVLDAEWAAIEPRWNRQRW